MPTQLQFRRGSTSQNNNFTGAVGEITIDTDTDALLVHDGSTAGGIEVFPSGSIIAFGGTTAPSGFLLCDGSNVSRTTYARLFASIATAYGNGDGSSTFGLPDLRDRTLVGKGTNNSTLGAEIGALAASSVMTTATGSNTGGGNTGTGTTAGGTTGTGTTGTGTTGGGTTGADGDGDLTVPTATFATSAKDSSTSQAVTSVTQASHTHTIPGLSIPGLSVPGLSVPGLSVPALSVPGLSIPALNATLPSSVVNFIIKT